MSTASTGVPVQPAGTIKVYAKRKDAVGAAKLFIEVGADVADLVEMVCAKLDLRVPADLVVLALENEDASVGAALDSRRTLAEAGITGGSTVIATVVAPTQPATTGSGGK
jgi:hypothetical protein